MAAKVNDVITTTTESSGLSTTDNFVVDLPAQQGLSSGEKTAIGFAIAGGALAIGAIGTLAVYAYKEHKEKKYGYGYYPYPYPQMPQVPAQMPGPINFEPVDHYNNYYNDQAIAQPVPTPVPQMQVPQQVPVAPQQVPTPAPQPVPVPPQPQEETITLNKSDHEAIVESNNKMAQQLQQMSASMEQANVAMTQINSVMQQKDQQIQQLSAELAQARSISNTNAQNADYNNQLLSFAVEAAMANGVSTEKISDYINQKATEANLAPATINVEESAPEPSPKKGGRTKK